MKYLSRLSIILLCLVGMVACSEEDNTWDPYYNWEARNAAWYVQIADSARTAIAEAKELFGDDWERHCEWRMYKSLMRSADINTGRLTDSVCVRVLSTPHPDDETTKGLCPTFSDSIQMNFRGWIMETEYMGDNGTKESLQSVFSQTYYGKFNQLTAAPQAACVSGTIEGFQTALQYMIAGDDWLVYIPQQLAYGAESSKVIPAYSTLLFRLNVVGVYHSGSGMPDWK